MRLTAFLLTVACLQVSARGHAQTVTLHVRDATLQQVFREISRQTGVDFFYNDDLLAGAKKVTLDVVDAPLARALDECFKGQPVEFVLRDGGIVVRKRELDLGAAADTVHGGVIKVRGVVLSEAGVPVQGANVTIKQTEKGTFTNARGEFELSAAPVGGVLVVSYVGYAAQSVTVKDASQIKVYMKVAQNDLDKAVVQAYGTTTQRLTTSDIGKVTAEEIERQPVMNPLLALEGKVAGLDVNMTSGYASAPVKVELRGRADINGSFTSDPLYIVDGVPLTINEVSGVSSYTNGSVGFAQIIKGPANGQSPFFSINPSDIESIAVLKDADATAIYGSRGANGVIIVTTKKGKAGKTKFDLHLQEGTDQVDRFWNMMNTQQYMAMRRQAFYNSGTVPSPVTDFDVNGTWDTTRYTNWQKVLYGGIGKSTDIQVSLSGGDARTTFRVAAGYNRTTGITTVSGADQRGSVSLNFTHRSLDQRLSISSTSNFSYTQSNMINLPSNILMAPDAPSIYDSLGNLNYNGWAGQSQNTNAEYAYPFGGLKQPYTAKTDFLNSNLAIGYEIIRGLQVSTNLGYNIAENNQVTTQPIASQNPANSPTGSLFLGYNHNTNLILEPQVKYSSIIRRSKLEILLGASYSQNNTESLYVNGGGYASDLLIHNISSAPSTSSADEYGEYRYFGGFARINYNIEDKYIINLNGRRDGSSRFGPGRQFGNFGSLGAAWIASEENWLRRLLPNFISFLKFRGSYGVTGSDAVVDYSYVSQFASNTLPYNNQTTLISIVNPNPNFRWQSNKKLEGAANVGFWGDKVNLQVGWYRDRCGNQLVAFPTPLFTGFHSVVENSPALVQNVGWEFTLSANIINTRKFNWSLSFNTAINQNKLISYPDFSQSPYVGILKVGQPLNITNVLHFTGVDPQTGQYTFLDKNHDGIINSNPHSSTTDTYSLSLAPRFFGGLGMNFRYSSVSLNLSFVIRDQIGKNAFLNAPPAGLPNSNEPASIYGKQWEYPGDRASIAQFTTVYLPSYSNFTSSDGVNTDASFIRLSSLAISYSITNNTLKKAGIQGCNLFLHTNNLFVITKYKGLDPETQNFGELPPTKTVVGGISINF